MYDLDWTMEMPKCRTPSDIHVPPLIPIPAWRWGVWLDVGLAAKRSPLESDANFVPDGSVVSVGVDASSAPSTL
jgi:hypothetical protein